jgi:aryl-alcohol dehydrogenase-like predicted oxidoreductase
MVRVVNYSRRMEYRLLGRSGLKVPALSFGTGTFGGRGRFFEEWGATDAAQATRMVDICMDAGITMFDSTDGYSDGLAEETLGVLDDMVHAGKIRYIGCSNFSGWHLMKSIAFSEKLGLARHVAHQAYYSLIGREYEWELMPLALDQGIGTVVWSPLGWARLTGKISRTKPAPAVSRLPGTRDAAPWAGTLPRTRWPGWTRQANSG